MEGKLIVYFVLFLGIMGLIFGIYHTTEVDEANKELASFVQQVDTLQNHLKNQTATLELKREVAAQLAVVDIMQKDIVAARKEIASYRDDESQARRDYEQAILKSRQDAAGLVLDELELPSGVRLRNARIQRVEGDTTTIIHSEGISKLAPEMLPRELQERFRFGATIGTPVLDKPAPALPTTTLDMPPAAAPAQKDKLKEARIQLEKLKKELPYLEKELKQAESDSGADSSPSRRFYAKNRRDALTQQVTALKRQIDSADLLVKKLEADL